MTRPFLAAFLLLLLAASSLSANDLYVPLGGPTELQIVNPLAHSTDITIELLGAKAIRITLDAGQTARWSDVAAEVFGQANASGALRIGGETGLQVTAATRCTACNASASVPVVAIRDAAAEGDVPPRMRATDTAWRSAIVVVNPDAAPVALTLAGESLVIPAGGMLRVSRESVERLPFHAAVPLLLFTYDTHEQSGARVYSVVRPHAISSKRRAMRSGSPAAPPPPPQTVILTPSKDNSLFQSFNGSVSNGAGVHLFTGATAGASLRRALLAFNVAAQIPPGSRITAVTLRMRVSLTIAGNEMVRIHRVNTDWGEGASNAGPSNDGKGAPAAAGDATWLHTFFPDRLWTAAGGDFSSAADATTTAGSGAVIWESSAAMVARVQEWLDQPATNFGWMITGNEQRATTAKRFGSREVSSETSRPSLTIEFQR